LNFALNKQKLFIHIKVGDSLEEFLGFEMSKFVCGSRAPVDIYVHLEDRKYLKVVRQGDSFVKDRVRSFQDREVKKLFLKKIDLSTYITYCLAHLKRTLLAKGKEQVKGFREVTKTADIVFLGLYETAGRADIGLQIEELANLLCEQAKSSDNFKSFVQDMLGVDNVVIRHCVATASLVFALVTGMKWQSANNVKALVCAALVHDLTLLDKPEVYLKSKDQWGPEVLRVYAEHPRLSASTLIERKMFEDDRIVRIVADHQELPDGSGFPNQLTLPRIFPMALPLIMVDRLVDLLLNPSVPLHNPGFVEAVRYLKNREERFYPVEYWNSLQSLSRTIL